MKRLSDMTEPELREAMNRTASMASASLPPGTLFVTLAFDDPGLAQYVSNCDRSTMVQALREAADRIEGRETIDR